MSGKQKNISRSGIIISLLVFINVIIIIASFENNSNWYWTLILSIPLLVLPIINVRQKSHALLRNFPLADYARYFLESIRPEIRQYFFESDLDGKPSTGVSGLSFIKERKTKNKR